MACLCAQTCYLRDRQIRERGKAFFKEGGIREGMNRARRSALRKSMHQRMARQGIKDHN